MDLLVFVKASSGSSDGVAGVIGGLIGEMIESGGSDQPMKGKRISKEVMMQT